MNSVCGVGDDNDLFQARQLLRIAKTNFIVLKLAAGGHKRDSRKPPEFDFSLHRHFPIIKLT